MVVSGRFSVDGVQFTDDFGLNNGGLPTSRGPVPFDAIEQFSVKIAPYDITEGDFQGGAINVVLRSGGNDFSGSAFFTYTDEKLTGDRTRGRNVALKFDSKQYGGIISGPIIKDKLFFMFGYEKTESSIRLMMASVLVSRTRFQASPRPRSTRSVPSRSPFMDTTRLVRSRTLSKKTRNMLLSSTGTSTTTIAHH